MPEDDWDDLDAAVTALRALPFPRGGRDPKLQEAHVSLVEYDGTVAGIVGRLLRDRGMPAFPLKLHPALRRELIGLSREAEPTKSEAESLLQYLDHVEEIVRRARLAVAPLA